MLKHSLGNQIFEALWAAAGSDYIVSNQVRVNDYIVSNQEGQSR